MALKRGGVVRLGELGASCMIVRAMNHDAAQPENATKRRDARGRRRPVLWFVVVLVSTMIIFNALFYAWFSKTKVFDSYLALNADVSAFVLRIFGEQAKATGVSVTSPRFALSIKRGCDAIQASVFFALLVAASPITVGRLRRLGWAVCGTLLLLVVNLLRIISLYYAGVWFSPELFEMMHVEVWQVAFILLPILLWLFWIRHVSKPQVPRPDVAA